MIIQQKCFAVRYSGKISGSSNLVANLINCSYSLIAGDKNNQKFLVEQVNFKKLDNIVPEHL